MLCGLYPEAKPSSPELPEFQFGSDGCNGIPLSEVQIQLLQSFNKLDFLHCFRDVGLQSTVGLCLYYYCHNDSDRRLYMYCM